MRHHHPPPANGRRKYLNRRPLVAAAAAVGLLGSVMAFNTFTAGAAGDAGFTDSNFEIEQDANLRLDGSDPNLDWASVNQTRGEDEPTGQNDDSFKGGTKEDTECPDTVTGSIPNNKSDLLTVETYEEAGDPGFFNFAWSRVSDPSGTTLMDFEFNQSSTPCTNGFNIQRTDGDLLVEYAIDQGGSRASIDVRRWDATEAEWGPSESLEDGTECDGGPCAVGTINSTEIPDAESDGLGTKAPRTFGEAQLNLDFIFDDNVCTSFGSLMVKSRSSDSFTSQLKDFIKPVPINLTNCAKIIVRKVTDPPGASGEFEFATNAMIGATEPGGSQTPISNFFLEHGESEEISNVIFGSYNVDEVNLPSGFDFVGVDCSASSTSTTYDDSAKQVTFTLDEPSDILDCTYTNRAKAKLTIAKVTDPSSDTTTSFGFSGDLGTFPLKNGESYFDDTLSPGAYTVTEDTPPAGWTLTNVSCDGGTGDVTSEDGLTLAAGDDVTCTFTNTGRGQLTIDKVVDADDLADGFDGDFDFTTNAGDPFTLSHGESETFTGLYGTYNVAETGLPVGWKFVSATCSNGDETAVFVGVNAAETCTFTNAIQRGAIAITKSAKHADVNTSPNLQAEFTISDANGVVVDTVMTDPASGLACVEGLPVSALTGVGDYTVTETKPAGYAIIEPQVVTVVESTCADGNAVAADFVNTPLTDLTIIIDSQVDGGTYTVVVCTDSNGATVIDGATPASGDETFSETDILPTDPSIVTITCEITIDP